MLMNNSLNEHCIMITGASRGIGAECAKHLAKLGARVAVGYSASLESAQKTYQELEGEGHLLVQINVQDPQSVTAGFEKFMKHFGKISALINNAGITKDSLVLRMSSEDFDSVVKTNLYGAFYCSKTAVKYMIKKREGSIINISSVTAKTGSPGQANYCASKAGLEGMTRSMALELAGRNIRINAIAPGFIETDMTKKLSEEQINSIKAKIPLNKLGAVQHIAQTAAFLLNSEYITGQVLAVNGGLAL